jgi:hypothetical protein
MVGDEIVAKGRVVVVQRIFGPVLADVALAVMGDMKQ